MGADTSSETVLEEWSDRFRKLVDGDAHASRSWQALVDGGICPLELSGMLAFSCASIGNPASQLIERFRSEGLAEVRKALRLAERLDADREALKGYSSSFPEGLIEKLTEGANTLRGSAIELRGLISRHKLNTNFFLAWLISSVQEKTGSPKYKEISILLDCAYAAYEMEMPCIGEEALRKTYSRFMKEKPLAKYLNPEGKQNLLLVAAFVAVIGLLVQAAKHSSSTV